MIEQSLRQVGAARSGVIDENGVILAGNGTYEALAAAGIDKVKVKGLTEEQKRALALADNRTAELAEWDGPALEAQGIDLAPWFAPWELAKVGVEPQPDDPNQHWRGMPECKQEDLSAWKSITVNFANAENLKAFAKLIDQPLTENTRSIWYPPAEIGHYADKRYTDES